MLFLIWNFTICLICTCLWILSQLKYCNTNNNRIQINFTETNALHSCFDAGGSDKGLYVIRLYDKDTYLVPRLNITGGRATSEIASTRDVHDSGHLYW